MNGAFYIGATGLDAQQRALDVVANNIANINTNGFKRSQPRFSELTGASPSRNEAGMGTAPASMPFWGATVDAASADFSQGPIKQTGQPLDVAINGAGFIELLGPSGQVQLWRGGTLQVNEDGLLASSTGTPLKAMIAVPAGTSILTINADGGVWANVDGATTLTNIGQIDIVQDKDLASLNQLTAGIYQPANVNDTTSGAPGQDGAGVLVQGSIESSNVDLSNEMISLLLMQRAYSANAQVVQAGDQLMSIANGLRR